MWAFVNCTRLEKVNIPNVTQIKEKTFLDCTNLKDIDLSKIDCIGFRAFNGCTSLTNVNLITTTRIDDEAFSGCTALKSVTLENLDTINKKVFYNCTSLETVDLGNVSYIDDNAFYNDENLKNIDLSNVIYIGDVAFCRCLKLESVDFTSAEYVGSSAFNNTSIKKLFIPAMTKFGDTPFSDCKLSSVTFEEGMDTLRGCIQGAFINNIEIPEGVKHIDAFALEIYGINGKNPTKTLPSTLTSMTSCPFGNGGLRRGTKWDTADISLLKVDKLIVMAETPPELLNKIYYYPLGLKLETTIYVPNGTSKKYKNDEVWGKYNILEMSELTGINGVTVDDAAKQGADDGMYYDLQGRKVTNPQKGVYIHQGKKAMIK